jgi:glycosyltransferase involved in cell wall biosynthesis
MKSTQHKHAVALVVADFWEQNGVSAVALFLHRVLAASDRYAPEIISLSSSIRDANSTRLSSPGSWFKRARRSTRVGHGLTCQHVGAELTELEFQRYRPRRALTELLERFELVQVVAGCPPLALVAKGFKGKAALQVATLTAVERVSILRQMRGARRAWFWLMTKINIALERTALSRADVIFVENRWMYELLSSRYDAGKIVFAPPGVDTNFFHPAEYKPGGHLLGVGRFSDPRKNVRLLFEVYQQLRQDEGGAPPLVLAGEFAPEPSDLAYAESLGILPYIEFRTNISREKLRTLYQDASLFLLSSNEEGLGLVVAEAMACGIPVVSTGCGGPETLVREGSTGYLTPVGDARAMQHKVRGLLDDVNLRRRMSRAARKRAVEHFSLEAAGKIFLTHYDALLGVS